MKNATFVILLLLVGSCEHNSKPKPVRHADLLGFKGEYVAESHDDTYRRYNLGTKLNKLRIRYVEDIIYVSAYVSANGCGEHFGNMKIRNDTIVLTYDHVSDIACTSTVIDKITYLIDNPKKRKRKIKFEE